MRWHTFIIFFVSTSLIAEVTPEQLQELLKLADKGDPAAQNNLANCYRDGEGVEKDPAKAVALYLKAANKGNKDAQFNLANCYRDGDGVEKNAAEALAWYRRLANISSDEARPVNSNITLDKPQEYERARMANSQFSYPNRRDRFGRPIDYSGRILSDGYFTDQSGKPTNTPYYISESGRIVPYQGIPKGYYIYPQTTQLRPLSEIKPTTK